MTDDDPVLKIKGLVKDFDGFKVDFVVTLEEWTAAAQHAPTGEVEG